MRLRDAIDLLAGGFARTPAPSTWADLGCGDGTFTKALAERLPPGSTIHAMDRDGSALRRLPSAHTRVRIATHLGDFTSHPWPFAGLDGVLMANSLHYVAEPAAFIRHCEPQMKHPARFVIVEYDTDQPNRWVPYPVGVARLTELFEATGYSFIQVLRTRPSIYRSAPLYSASIQA
jgi:SAM-dependent methyltransferase